MYRGQVCTIAAMDPSFVDDHVLPAVRSVLTSADFLNVFSISVVFLSIWLLCDLCTLLWGYKTPGFVHATEEYNRNGGNVRKAVQHAWWIDFWWYFSRRQGIMWTLAWSCAYVMSLEYILHGGYALIQWTLVTAFGMLATFTVVVIFGRWTLPTVFSVLAILTVGIMIFSQ